MRTLRGNCSRAWNLGSTERAAVVTRRTSANLLWVDVQHLGGVAACNGNKTTGVHLAGDLHHTHIQRHYTVHQNTQAAAVLAPTLWGMGYWGPGVSEGAGQRKKIDGHMFK